MKYLKYMNPFNIFYIKSKKYPTTKFTFSAHKKTLNQN